MRSSVYKIAEAYFDVNVLTLKNSDKEIKLSAKVADLFLLFLQSDDQIVSINEAIHSVWQDNEAVGKKGFANAIWVLRKAFKDLGIEDDIFETLPKVGYRFLLPVTPVVVDAPVASERRQVIKPALFVVSTLLVMIAIISVVWFHFDGHEAKTAQPVFGRLEKVTAFEGVEEHIALSNNDKYIAFVWQKNPGLAQIYIKDLTNEQAAIRLVSSGVEAEASPSWSPTDEELVYTKLSANNTCSLFIKNLLLSDDLSLNDNCYYSPYRRVVNWSRDNTIYYSRQLADRVAIFKIAMPEQIESQFSFPRAGEVDYAPNFDPINNELYFVREQPGSTSLRALSIDKQEREVIEKSLGIVDFDLDSESQLLYVNYLTSGGIEIAQISTQGEIVKNLTAVGLPSSLAFSSTDGYLYLVEHISKEYVAQISLNSGKILRKISSSSRDMYGSYSTVTDDIYFLSDRSKKWAVWANNRVVSKNITKNLGDASVPSVSPDGKYFATVIQDNTGKRKLYLFQTGGEDFEIIETGDIYADFLSWSSDSQTLYFSSVTDGKRGIFSIDKMTKEITKLTNDGEIFARSNGDGVLYTTKQNQNGLWRFNTNTQESSLVTSELSTSDFGSFFIQNDAVIFLKRTADADIVVRIDNGVEEELLSYPPNSFRKFFGISPGTNDTIIATLKVANESDINKVKFN